MDTKKIESAVKDLIVAIGEDPDREGLQKTPSRVAKMFCETLEGIQYSNDDIARMFDKCFSLAKSEEMVVVNNIPCFSLCEHHLALMYNMHISVGYIPKDKVIGLSKIARIADMVCKRLQLQERIGQDIGYILGKILDTDSVAVLIEAEHACMTTRGIKRPGSKTRTFFTNGIFAESASTRSEFLSLVKA